MKKMTYYYDGNIDLDKIIDFQVNNKIRTCVEVKTQKDLTLSIDKLRQKY